MATEMTQFEPRGGIRGIAVEILEVKGKQRRIGHAHLVTSGPQLVSVDLPKTLSLDDLRLVANRLLAFADEIEKS